MWSDFLDTIVARATPLGSGGVCIVRLSGSQAMPIADRLFVRDRGGNLSDARPQQLVTGTILLDQKPIDHGLAVRFRAPRSYTGEDVVELHLHGNSVIAELVIESCIRAGARVAAPGEFTRRAFVNGRMDLTQVESLADLLAAESREALVAAENGLRGGIRDQLTLLREQVLSVLARLELELDFAEEGYAFTDTEAVRKLLETIRTFAGDLLAQYDRGELVRRHPRVLLLGNPNAGKSSFFNVAVGYARALVSEIAGTTRDYIEETMTCEGVRFSLIDSAGLRSADESLEYEGIRRALELADRVDHLLILVDSQAGDPVAALRHAHGLTLQFRTVPSTVVLSKVDSPDQPLPDVAEVFVGENGMEEARIISCSCLRPETIRTVLNAVAGVLSSSRTDASYLVTERQKGLLRSMIHIVDDVMAGDLSETAVVSAELRRLLLPLSDLSGSTVSDDVLKTVFSSFCIGK